ncbi:MAG TPA: LysR substrate-binding domain-containing protein, partial [Steroidobacteraceae bacterium]|nr:LysR substrate-binding domain-containing protein [Steroidobacteraceae bacterium]
YIQQCRRLLDEIREMEHLAAGEYSAPKGQLIVSAPLVFGRLHLLPVITQFLGAYPDIEVKLSLSDRVVNLLEDRIDVALRIGELPHSSLIATRLGSINVVTCASPSYLKRRGTPKEPKALADHDCVTFEGLAAPDLWRFGTGRAEESVRVRSRLVVSTAEAAIDAAIAGAGITRILSYQIQRAVSEGRLTRLLKTYDSAPRPVSFAYRMDGTLPKKIRAFLDFASPRLREALLGS